MEVFAKDGNIVITSFKSLSASCKNFIIVLEMMPMKELTIECVI